MAGEPLEGNRAQRALDLAATRGERGNEAWALWLLGEIAVRGEPADAEAARARYRQARALADERGMRPLAAHCHLGFGGVAARAGDRDGAHGHLVTATAMYREMDMRLWLERAEAALRALPAG